MQVRQVTSARASDRPDLFAASSIRVQFRHDRFEVRVVGLHISPHPILLVGVEDDDNVAPAGSPFPRPYDATVGDSKDRIAEITIFPSDTVEVIAQVAIFREGLRIVGERALLASDREVEALRSW